MTTAEDVLAKRQRGEADQRKAEMAQAKVESDAALVAANERLMASMETAAAFLESTNFEMCRIKQRWMGKRETADVATVYLMVSTTGTYLPGGFWFAPTTREILTNPVMGDEARRHHQRDVTSLQTNPDRHYAIGEGWLFGIYKGYSADILDRISDALDELPTRS